MLAAEAGADYVMFGEPDENGARPAFAAVEERVAWWAEVFEIALRRLCRRARRGCRRWSRPAPISSRSATGSGTTAQSASSPPPRATSSCRSRRHERRAARTRRRARPRSRSACPALAQPAKKPPLPRAGARRRAEQANVDLAYGAFQRGLYLTALAEAEKRAKQNDPAAMTLLGQLYADGLGVGRRRRQGGAMVQARRRPRRPQRHVRARHVRLRRPRRPARSRQGRQHI